MKVSVLAVTLAAVCPAGETRYWRQDGFAEFEKGVLKNLSLRSDGRLTLAPASKERLDSSSAYLWALARDSKGNLYAGGGPAAKLYRIAPGGAHKTVAEFEALEIHAIAVDNKDRVFVATSPDGKVYRVSGDEKPEVFYEPKAKYIWSMIFDGKGNLYVATGDQGEVHRVAADGKGAVFFRTDETHARALAVDSSGNLIVGTEPSGLVVRVSPDGKGFVLHQLPKKEVTAVAVASDGSIYAAGVGNKQPGTTLPPPPPSPAPASASAPAATVVMTPQRPASAPPPLFAPSGSGVAGGSEIYRIYPDGNPRKVWSHAQDVVYALGFDGQGRVLAGTGNKGAIYRLDSDLLYTALVNAAPTQVTSFCAGRDGTLYIATGNSGKVYQLGPAAETEGSIESEVLDARLFSQWGRLTFEGNPGGGRIEIATRSGNLDQPRDNSWSAWSAPIAALEGERITSPPARFMQWRATLRNGAVTPDLSAVEAAYLQKNVAPRIEQIEPTPPNYRFPAPSAPAGPSQSLTLPPLGRPSRSNALAAGDSATTPSLTYAKGHIGARWASSDENQDTLIYTVHIRGEGEKEWKLLKDKVREKHVSWDSTAFPDGWYRLRVTASDAPSNPKDQAAAAHLDSEAFLIDNTAPRITGLAAQRGGSTLTVRWKASDALTVIEKAEYSLDGGDWTAVSPFGRVSDSRDLEYELSLDNLGTGEHTIAVRVRDEYDNLTTEKVLAR